MGNATKRFFGEVGYDMPVTDDYGVTTSHLVKRNYYGDVQHMATRWQNTENLHDDISVNHRISIIADPFANQNFPFIKYVEWMGTRWNVNSADLEYPRLILTLGGVYNGPQD